MPKSKRSPIEYTPQFGGGIFRSREVVEDELAAATQDETPPPARTRPRPTASRSQDRSNDATNERTKIRHTFDIFQDQLLALAEIQAARFRQTGRKPKMGDLVQEALDGYIERSNDRTTERSSGQRPSRRDS